MSLRLPRRLDEIVSAPTWPGTLERPVKGRLGVDYDTSWTRSVWARTVRRGLVEAVTRPLVAAICSPVVYGREHLEAAEGPLIFAANHSSHLDTSVVVSSLPERFRRRLVIAAAADYFYDRTWKAIVWSLWLGAIPIERSKVGRKSSDLAAELLEEGYSLLIFPEGGRTTDGWGQEFRGGAAYLAKRCRVGVVPVHLRGVRPVLPKGSGTVRRHHVEVRFGAPLATVVRADGREEDARRFALRVESAVAVLADEAESDWWSARRRAAEGETAPYRGPDVSTWRRAWALPESARRSVRHHSKAAPW